MASSMPDDPLRKQGRGITWTHTEILELISLWGEERIQRELNANHRNHNIYAKISGKLMEKEISRSVKEIRNKCKTLKSEYNKVNNHNKISGNAPATCPFFAEMDRFLHTDRSVFPKRITKSLHIVRKPTGGPSQASSQPPKASQHQDASMTTVVTVEAPVHTVVRRVRDEEDIPDRRARRGKLIARTIIEDSRREGQLNCALARRQHKSLLRTIGREAASLESLARSYRKDLAVTAQYRQWMFGYMQDLINVCHESFQEQQNRTAVMERALAWMETAPGSLRWVCKNKTKSKPAPESITGTQILLGDLGDEGPAPATCLVPCSEPTQTQENTQNSQPSQSVLGKTKRLIKKKQLYSPS
ncbi:hypothetical protein JD844_024261 [Phrynosoma platyrhinos]|uniref:Myb/SANT-like DNA-binding domain-containing protein n=1 Tax=Phrynosoma platyrhinos TaxID=52577 RepID=A0ABQ7SYP8_PHRPL|nr:hypothetical protein JD844_024261 [Phrynosoma platyrhinos]